MPDRVIISEDKIRIQKKTQWCYAAIVQMIIEHYDKKTVSQPDIVKSIAGNTANNEPQDPYKYLDDLHHIYSMVKDQPPDPFTIRTQIDMGCPIIVRVGTAGSGHYMLIVGYSYSTPSASRKSGREDTSISRVWYIDPLKKKYTKETGLNSNSRVECEYEDHVTKKAERGKDDITGYFLTCSKEVCEPLNRAAASKARLAEEKKAAAAAAAAASASASAAPSKTKRGGRYSRRRKMRRRTIRRK